MNIKKMILLLASPLLLAACDRDRIPNICEDTPQYCVNLHEDSWCKFERTALIRARKENGINQSDANAYQLINKLTSYHDCLSPLLDIEYKRRKERKTDKVDAVYYAQEALQDLAVKTKDSDYPYLLLWHWQHEGNYGAKSRFLKLADRPEMQEPELQNALGELLMLRDQPRAERAFHRALSLYKKDQEINTDIIANILTIFINQQNYEQAWIWTRVLSKLDYKENIDTERMDAYAKFNETERQEMQNKANDIVSKLAKGTYQVPLK
ncbi:DUF2989 domain-containing protein [Oceanisphaera avium]|uniref:DUF2989 domain-containing protein n=1 Tax=Oceanisphaera avium TaxID=1903694 RepID=A0A1Y0CWI8_9GAMM|nr:DUF2989 domain-containing protein [Oceanisphaera avium]ART79588.1 hypothetical protein CBP12_04990 [Oceanisphaera avium]